MNWVTGEEIKERIKYKGYIIEHFFFGSANLWRVKKGGKILGQFPTKEYCEQYIDSL